MDAGAVYNTEWTTATGSRRDAARIPTAIDHYLKQRGYFDQWPESGSSIGGYGVQRVAPFKFYVVAVDPLVVIMAPHDFGNPKGNRSIYNIVGPEPKQAFGSPHMLNYIEYGTRLPYNTNLLWFSPEISSAPLPLTAHGETEMELVNQRKHLKLVLKKSGDCWTTERIKP